jgi:hypothetical protein
MVIHSLHELLEPGSLQTLKSYNFLSIKLINPVTFTSVFIIKINYLLYTGFHLRLSFQLIFIFSLICIELKALKRLALRALQLTNCQSVLKEDKVQFQRCLQGICCFIFSEQCTICWNQVTTYLSMMKCSNLLIYL